MDQSIEQLKRRNVIIIGIAILLMYAALAGKPIWQALTAGKQYGVKPPPGHYTIWDWTLAGQTTRSIGRTVYPTEVRALAGKQVRVQGFLLPLRTQSGTPQLVLVPQPRECYAAKRPSVTEFMYLQQPRGKQLIDTTKHVWAYGVLSLATDTKSHEPLFTLHNAIITGDD